MPAADAPPTLPDRGPFVVRSRLLTPLAAGGHRFDADGRLEIDATGRIAAVGSWDDGVGSAGGPAVFDLRPWLVLPGLVDLHAHLPQLPNAGLGFGLPLLDWLRRYVFPLEQDFDEATAEVLAPAAFRAFAAAGTTTVLLYGALWEPSLDASFRAAEAHGIRAIIGKVMMDRLTYDESERSATETLELSLRQSADLCARWHMRDDGRLRYAFTPRFAVSCSAEMLRESARLARDARAVWQTHVSEDVAEIAEVRRLFPEALDYVDVYDRAGGLGPGTVLAHAVHLADREVARLVETGTRIAHCPASNLFLSSGTMPLARYVEAGLTVGLGSDVAGGPDLSIFGSMRVGAYVQNALRVSTGDNRPILSPFDWLRLGTLDGARALGLDSFVGSLEPGKEADFIAVDPTLTAAVRPTLSAAARPVSASALNADVRTPASGAASASTLDGAASSARPLNADLDDPADILSRLIFRTHPDMVRAAYVRGRRLAGPA